MEEHTTLAQVRRFLLSILIVGVVGLSVELVLLGHVDGVLQLAPVAILGAGLLALLWHAFAPTPATVHTVRAAMWLFVISGAAGVALHYRGNVEFELEMYPSLSGVRLVRETLTGATPVLAPGSMTLLGLVGLAHTYGHPQLRQRLHDRSAEDGA